MWPLAFGVGRWFGVKRNCNTWARCINGGICALKAFSHAPNEDVKNLQQLTGHMAESWFITKFRKIFARDEMNDDLNIVPARYNGAEDHSEYEELFPVSPP